MALKCYIQSSTKEKKSRFKIRLKQEDIYFLFHNRNEVVWYHMIEYHHNLIHVLWNTWLRLLAYNMLKQLVAIHSYAPVCDNVQQYCPCRVHDIASWINHKLFHTERMHWLHDDDDDDIWDCEFESFPLSSVS